MISILIPTYNYVCYPLVSDLQHQAEGLGEAYEIVVAEDGSQAADKIAANSKITELTHCRHIVRTQNVGRAAIRNFLMDEAKGDVLLFIDADAQVIRQDFLDKYLKASKQHAVVCGGVKHPDTCPDPSKSLYWRYAHNHEQQHGIISEQLSSFSFLIHRDVAHRVRFNENYTAYGYEDVQFGIDLRQAGFRIQGIDNPLLNTGIDDNATYLKKTELALTMAYQHKNEIGNDVTLVRLYRRLHILGGFIRTLFRLTYKPLRRNLLSTNPSLRLFSFYRLGYYASLNGK